MRRFFYMILYGIGSFSNLQRTPCQPLPRERSPDGASTECGGGHLIAFIDPERMKGWVGLVGWPMADGLPTCGHPSATGWAQDGERTLTRDWRSTAEPREPAMCAYHYEMYSKCANTVAASSSEMFSAVLTIQCVIQVKLQIHRIQYNQYSNQFTVKLANS